MINDKIVTLINPNLVFQKNDMFTTGIVYMPIGLAITANVLREAGYNCKVIDSFGEKPDQWWHEDQFILRGLTPPETVDKIDTKSRVILLYAINLTYHRSLVYIIRTIRERDFHVPLIVMENTQAVTAYSIRRIQDEFYELGVDYIITGESEERVLKFLQSKFTETPDESMEIDGLGYRDNEGLIHYTSPVNNINNLDMLPFPAWDLFPIERYWSLRYSHGPLSRSKYLPLQTSRGCPYACNFCVIPETNNRKWRGRSAKNVVDEIEFFKKKYGVAEFHIEDLNPTVNDERTREICNEIISRGLKIIWKISAGTKIESIKDEITVELMARAGCKYISVSPESGSPRVMKMINKPFNYDHAIRMIKKMNMVGIKSQACFVLGFPGEESSDRELTKKMIIELTKVGVDEIAIFIITPVQGSSIYNQIKGFTDYSQLNFSPEWRSDYKELSRCRLDLYKTFLKYKIMYHPLKVMRQGINFISRKFETKMEMTPYRALVSFLMIKKVTGKLIEYRYLSKRA